MPILFNFGWENTLYLYGNTPPYTYSDMNGYGHFVPALFWAITYWLSISCFLATLSVAFARRGADDAWRARIRLAMQRAPRLIPAAALFLFIATGSGVWYFYNSHVLNEYLTAKDRRDIQRHLRARLQEVRESPPAQDHRGRHQHRHFPGAPLLLRHRPLRPAEQDRAAHRTDPHHQPAAVRLRRALRPPLPRGLRRALAPSTPSTSSIRRWRRATSSTSPSTSATPAAASRTATNAPSSPTPAPSSTPATSPPSATTSGIEIDDPRRRREEDLPEQELLPSSRRPRGRRHQSLHSAIRLDQLPHHRQHLRRPDRPLPRLSHARLARQRPPLLHLRHGQRQDPRLHGLRLRPLQRQARNVSGRRAIPSPSRSTTPPATPTTWTT